MFPSVSTKWYIKFRKLASSCWGKRERAERGQRQCCTVFFTTAPLGPLLHPEDRITPALRLYASRRNRSITIRVNYEETRSLKSNKLHHPLGFQIAGFVHFHSREKISQKEWINKSAPYKHRKFLQVILV